MSFDILLQLKLFTNDDDIPRTRKCLLHILEALVNINRVWLKYHPETPLLYRAGVIYAGDPRPIGPDGDNIETWIAIPEALERGGTDCKNLVAWRCAELREKGVKCWPRIKWKQITPDFTLYHVVVEFPAGSGMGTPEDDDGKIVYTECPSRILGMGRDKPALEDGI